MLTLTWVNFEKFIIVFINTIQVFKKREIIFANNVKNFTQILRLKKMKIFKY